MENYLQTGRSTQRLAMRLGTLGSLFIFFALGLGTLAEKTPTVDEPVYIGYGRQLWLFRRERRLSRQPPLSDWLIGSLLTTEPNLPDLTQMDAWVAGERQDIAHEFLWERGLNVERIVFLARLPVLFAGLLMGSLMARWVYERQGLPGQLALSLLLAFAPNLLAFSSLATTDLPITAAYFAALFTLWLYWRKPSPRRYGLAGICLGLALGVKITALLLVPLALILCYSQWNRGQPWWRPGLVWLGLLPVAGLTLWVLYGFDISPVSGLPFPVPAGIYADSFVHVESHIERGHGAYLLGQLSHDGWWYYFIVALLVKAPLVVLALAGLAAGLCLVQRRWQQDIFLWLPATALLAIASYTRLNIGYRHILPVEPLLMVWAVTAVPWLLQKRLGQIALSLALGWYALAGMRQYPHYLAYFNELVGGSAQGYRYLSDSNIDWGQDLNLVADYQKRTGLPSINLSHFGTSDPAHYGIRWQRLSDEDDAPTFAAANPPPGVYAISVTHLLGSVLPEPDAFDWFRRHTPVETLGYSIFIYQVSQPAQGAWIAHCLDPVAPLAASQASRVVGQDNLRQVFFDCRHSWVFPDGAQPGWYILPLGEDTTWIEKHFPAQFTQVYKHVATTLLPSYAVYYWKGQADLVQQLTRGLTQSALTANNRPISLPVRFGQTVELAGYEMDRQNWHTVWQVYGPAPAPLSIKSHFFYGEPPPVVADGLGFSSEQWQPGDIFVQWYALDQAAPAAFLETGLYNYLDGEPLTFEAAGQNERDVRLAPPR